MNAQYAPTTDYPTPTTVVTVPTTSYSGELPATGGGDTIVASVVLGVALVVSGLYLRFRP